MGGWGTVRKQEGRVGWSVNALADSLTHSLTHSLKVSGSERMFVGCWLVGWLVPRRRSFVCRPSFSLLNQPLTHPLTHSLT